MTTTAEQGGGEETRQEDEVLLQFLDSLDGYLSSMDSLSSILRQGWLELAGARHSMGSSRISSTLFDLKPHSAATTVELNESTGTNGIPSLELYFSLSKWGSHEGQKCSSVEDDFNRELQSQAVLRLRRQNHSGFQGAHQAIADSTTIDDQDQAQKKRSKSLSMFGTLVSPKLRDTQVSFETALESIIEMANRKSMILSTFSRLQQVDSSN